MHKLNSLLVIIVKLERNKVMSQVTVVLKIVFLVHYKWAD
jgi:hypothetical protein